jgi:hypothetical protein
MEFVKEQPSSVPIRNKPANQAREAAKSSNLKKWSS